MCQWQGGRPLSTGNIVGTWDVDREADDVVDVDIMNSTGVDGYVDNQLSAFGKGDLVVKKFTFRD